MLMYVNSLCWMIILPFRLGKQWSEDIIKKVYRDYHSILVQTLPMEDAIFASMLYTKNLFSGDLKDQVTSKNTCAEKAKHFLDNVIEKSLCLTFSLLLDAMIEYKSIPTNTLAKEIKQELDSHVSSDSAQVTGNHIIVLLNILL